MALLDPGFELTLRPMKYPQFYEAYKDAWKNHWMVEEVNFAPDLHDLNHKLTDAQKFMIRRLVAFFATGDTIVSNNLVLNLYKHINSPEARMYLGRQLAEEMVHVDFYKQLLDYYIQDPQEQAEAFAAVDNIPSIKRKADFAFKWIDSLSTTDILRTADDRRNFLMVLITFAGAIEGLFFMGAFAYVYYMRSLGLLPGLAEGTNWVFRDESCHMNFAFSVIDVIRAEEPELFNAEFEARVVEMLKEALECEMQFAEDALELGLPGFTAVKMRQFLEFCVDARLRRLGMKEIYGTANPFSFMVLQDMAPLTNFFEKRVTEYAIGNTGTADDMSFDEDF